MTVNKVILVGNAGRDPEVRYTASGAAVCNLSIATTRKWKDKASGERQEETEWHRVSLFDKLAEIAGEYVKKGRTVYIEGRLKTRKWTDKDGVEKYTTEVLADTMQLIGKAEQQDGGTPSAPARRAAPGRQAPGASRPPPTTGGFDDMDDDIPF